tara:strand:+ start:10878 stop:12722 length:1845 start_codon:yes stop_codon:yes gene_type:complete
MFELEVDNAKKSIVFLPKNILREFEKHTVNHSNISGAVLTQWEEHCTECAAPSCYNTCELYESRPDGRCRRFKDGIELYHNKRNDLESIVRIEFKKWASLLTQTNQNSIPLNTIIPTEKKARKLELLSSFSPLNSLTVLGRKGLPIRLIRRMKTSLKNNESTKTKPYQLSDYFIFELINDEKFSFSITLSNRALSGNKNQTPYQKKLDVLPGYNKFKIQTSEMAPFINLGEENHVTLTPNIDNCSKDTVVVYIRDFGFYSELSACKPVKVLVWDLDNTLWDGILVEDEVENVFLKKSIIKVLKTLDQRGIVCSIASKNDYDNAWKKLTDLGISQYFLFPQINWGPKSQSIKQIATDFNVNIDTIAFIDDSEFERKEVSDSCSQLRIYHDAQYLEILEKDEFNPELSSESSRRREFYTNQKARKNAVSDFPGDYMAFLKQCDMHVHMITNLLPHIDRVHELSQRTNQMNFSTMRYTKEEIRSFITNPEKFSFAMQAKDNFGDYGIVGFAVFDIKKSLLEDLMFSCRVQSKKVEHEVLLWLIRKAKIDFSIKKILASYKPTEKNTQSGKVFDDLHFSTISYKSGIKTLEYPIDQSDAPLGVLTITTEDKIGPSNEK